MGKIERIQVPPEDRERLARLVRDRNTPQKIVCRSRIMLLVLLQQVEFECRSWTETSLKRQN
jgi:hypothetical protein